ncbi:kfra protein [Photorhabdus luminescens]|nr:kfra protein [Photorhabdus luminescens]
MRPATFEPEIIIEAGKALQAEGRNVTAFALRSKIGGGNASRLLQVWAEFITSQTTITTEPVAELPAEVAEEVKHVSVSLTERINQLVIELNDKAVKAAERRVADVTRAAGEQTVQAERELADAAQIVDDLETQLDESYAEVSDLKQQLAESQLLVQHQTVELAQLKERLSATEQAMKVSSEQHSREQAELRERLSATEKAAKAESGQYSRELVQWQQKLATTEQAVKAVSERYQSVSDELKVTRQRSNERIETLKVELAELKVKAAADAKVYVDYQMQSKQNSDRNDELLKQLKLELDTAHREATEARETSAKITGQLEAVQAQNATLLAAVQKRQDELIAQIERANEESELANKTQVNKKEIK